MACRVVVVGSYNQDHVWPLRRMVREGETMRTRGFVSGPGGKGFNQAVACARQGVSTAFIASRGHDAMGENAERLAAAEHIEGYWRVDGEHHTGSACVLLDREGRNRIIVDLGANEHLADDYVQGRSAILGGARVLLTQMETAISAVTAALRLGREQGLLSLLNPAPVHPGATPEDLRLADVLLPNEGEFAQLCRRFAEAGVDAGEVWRMNDEHLHALARRLSGGTVVVTLGGHGCFVSHGDIRHGDTAACYRVPAEPVEVVDTTAAGDAFCGSLAAAAASDRAGPFRRWVVRANRVAGMATERRGAALVMPRRAEVDARFTD